MNTDQNILHWLMRVQRQSLVIDQIGKGWAVMLDVEFRLGYDSDDFIQFVHSHDAGHYGVYAATSNTTRARARKIARSIKPHYM
jgi:hypothetical protein